MTVETIRKYFPHISDEQEKKFRALMSLYNSWNNQINIISRKDIDFLYEKHVLHSLAIGKVCNFLPDEEVMDVGTGGGFPGIPLAILFPETRFTLVDSIGKKIKVVEAISKALSLHNVTTIHNRVENIPHQFDFITSRAVTRLHEFNSWVKTKLKNNSRNTIANGILYLKGGDLTEEIVESKLLVTVIPISNFFEEDFFKTKFVLHIPY